MWELVLVGLLHDVAGESQASISRRLGVTSEDVHRRHEEHRRAFERDERYSEIVTEVCRRSMLADHPALPLADLLAVELVARSAPTSSCERRT